MARNFLTYSANVLNSLPETTCDYTYGFQGYKFDIDQTYDDVKRKVLKSINQPKIVNDSMNHEFDEELKRLIKKSEVIVNIYEMVRNTFSIPLGRMRQLCCP